MKKRAFEKLLREAIILEAEEQGARLAGVPTEPVPEEAQARFNASLKTERQTAARETVQEIPVKQESRARRIARGWMTAGIAVVTTAALIFVIGLMAVSGISKGTKAAEAQPADQQPPEWTAEAQPNMPEEQPEAPAEEPKETSAPAPGAAEQQPPEPGDDLPEVKTVVYPWQGYDCLIPEGFVSAHESDQEFISITSEMNDRNMFQMAYELEPTETLEGWDSDVFSEQHLKILLSKIGVPESQYADFVGHSVRTVENGVVCYHLYNRSQKVYACLARVLSDEKNSLIAVGMTLGEYGVGEFDSVVNALAQRYTEAIPEDPEQPELQLKTQEWQGYDCLFPETFEIQAIRDQKLSATEKALLKLDMDALQTVGLTDMDYYLVAESMLNGKDLLTWYLTADGWDDKPEDFDTAESVEIVPGIVSVHYYNRNYDSYICIAKLNTIGTNILFLSASSLTKDGTADFDSIVKQFVKINGDFAPSDNDILNGKYGISKVFSGDDYQITLTEQFSEQKSEMVFDGYYTSYFGAVMIKIEPFTLKAGLADKTLTEYIQDVIRNNNSDAQPEERDGLVFYRYCRSGMCGWNFAFKGDTAFYLVQFMCREADESELTDLFFAFAKSMKINQSSEKANVTFEIKSLIGTWTMIDPPSSAQGYTFELVFESDEKVTLNVSQSGKTGSVAFTYIITDNAVHLYMESYEVYPDGSIVKEKQEYYLFVSDGVMTYDLETDTLSVPNDEGGQTRFIRSSQESGSRMLAFWSAADGGKEGELFGYDLNGDGVKETISFRTEPDGRYGKPVLTIDKEEYPLDEFESGSKLQNAILLQPDDTSEDLALVLTVESYFGDFDDTYILFLHDGQAKNSKTVSNFAAASFSLGKLRISQRCWLIGTYFGSRAYVGPNLEPESEWYETGVLDHVKDMTRDEQIEFNWLFKAIRDVPCTIDGKPAVIEAGTWMYLLRWKDTDDFAELETEDGRIITVAFTPEYDQYLDGTTYVSKYLIDGIDAESYFENLCMAG